jgi:hypothetical protein
LIRAFWNYQESHRDDLIACCADLRAETLAESREKRAENREQKAESTEHRAESRERSTVTILLPAAQISALKPLLERCQLMMVEKILCIVASSNGVQEICARG